jgi:hypothetical protein
VRAELSSRDVCSAAGIVVQARAPVLSLCRKLIEAGVDPSERLEVYRGGTLALVVRAIGDGAKLTVAENDRFGPYFAPWKPSPFSEGSPPAAPNGLEAIPVAPQAKKLTGEATRQAAEALP